MVPGATLPTPGSVGYDLFSADDYIVGPGRRCVVSTGISARFPEGTYGRIEPRTGLAVKHGVTVLAGIVDPDNTGEIRVVLQNHDPVRSFVIRPGYRIAQMILSPFVMVPVQECPPPI